MKHIFARILAGVGFVASLFLSYSLGNKKVAITAHKALTHENVPIHSVADGTLSGIRVENLAPGLATIDGSESFMRYLERVSASTISEMRDCHAALERVETTRRGAARLFLYARWADLDCADAVAFSDQIGSKVERFRTLEMLLMYLAANDFEAALSSAEGLKPGSERDVLVDLILRSGGEGQVALLKRLIAKNGNNIGPFYQYLSKVAETDPAGAAAQIMTLTDFNSRQSALDAVLRLWAGKDFIEAKQWLEQHLSDKDLVAAMRSLYSHVIPINPQAAIELVKGFPAGQLKTGLVTSLGMALYNKDPNAAVSWAEQELGSVQKCEMFFNFARSLLNKEDVEGAKKFLEILPYGTSRDVLQSNIAEILASKDMGSALKWLGQMDPIDSANAAPTILSVWARTDPITAANYAAGLSGPTAQDSLEAVMKSWGAAEPQAALDWVAGIDVNLRERAETTIVKSWSKAEPDNAVIYIDNMAEGPQKTDLLCGAIGDWVRVDREAAAKYLEVEGGESNVIAIGTLVSMWAATDSLGASEWVQKLEPGASHDMASLQLAISVVRTDPESATQWAMAISNPIQREETLRAVFNMWSANNPQQARIAAQGLGLEGQDKKVVDSIFK